MSTNYDAILFASFGGPEGPDGVEPVAVRGGRVSMAGDARAATSSSTKATAHAASTLQARRRLLRSFKNPA